MLERAKREGCSASWKKKLENQAKDFVEGLLCHPKVFSLCYVVMKTQESDLRTTVESVFYFSKVTWRGCVKWNERKDTGGRDQVGGYCNAVGASDKDLSQDREVKGRSWVEKMDLRNI